MMVFWRLLVAGWAMGPWLAMASSSIDVDQVLRQRFDGDRTGACVQAALIDGADVRRASFCARAAKMPAADAAFEIGSITKTMLGVLVADLVERGAWSLDDPIQRHLPEGTIVPRQGERQILVRDLVTHSAALPPLPPLMRPASAADPYATLSEQQVLDSLVQVRLGGPIGARAQYSNFGAMALSLAVARAHGGDLEQALRERLFEPLGMRNSYVARAPAGQPVATGHEATGRPTAPWTITPNLAGVGMVRAPLADMVRYAQAVLKPDDSPAGRAIRRSQAEVAHGLGMFWARAQVRGEQVLAHEGGTGGFSSVLMALPERGRAAVVLADTALTDLGGLSDVALALLGLRPQPLPPRTPAALPGAWRQALPGEYTLAGTTLRLQERDGRIVAQVSGQPEFELKADSRGDLYPDSGSALVTPRVRDGRIDELLWRQGGGAIEARRIGAQPAYTAQNPAWKPWAGEYALLPGLDLRVFEQDGRLMLQGTGQGAFPVEVVGDDEVESKAVGVRVRFRRNDRGEVIGIHFTQGGQTLQAARK